MNKKTHQYTWDLTPLLSTEDDKYIKNVLQKTQRAIEFFQSKWENREDYLSDPHILKQALDEYEELMKNHGYDNGIGYYFQLKESVEENNPKIKGWNNKLSLFENEMRNKIRFFTHRLARVNSETQTKFLSDPTLSIYQHYLELLFQSSRYLLSEQEERINSLLSPLTYDNWLRMTQGFLSSEEKTVKTKQKGDQKVSLAQITSLMNDTDKQTRDTAAKAFNEIMLAHRKTAEHELNSILQNKQIQDSLRKIDRPDRDRHLADDIETEVVDTMLSAVEKRFAIAQKYYTLKAALLKVPKLAYHERNVPYGSLDISYSFEESVNLMNAVFNHAHPDFAHIFQSFLRNNQIDVYPKKGKRGGAFCSHHRIIDPTYILLNHTNKLQDVLTFAHELGHGINNELVRRKQHSLHFGTPTSTAEVASTFMEDFVLGHIGKEITDTKTKLSLMMMKLNDDISSIFRQVACYRFEQELHSEFRKQGYLPHETIGKIFQKHMSAYMGLAVEQSAGSENWWVYWPHIRYYFYVYSYASGLLISKALQSQVKKDKTFINHVINFLSVGYSEKPSAIFKKIGIDITKPKFWNDGLDEVENLLSEAERIQV